mgnify:FL=1|jgi:hypothetical protein
MVSEAKENYGGLAPTMENQVSILQIVKTLWLKKNLMLKV